MPGCTSSSFSSAKILCPVSSWNLLVNMALSLPSPQFLKFFCQDHGGSVGEENIKKKLTKPSPFMIFITAFYLLYLAETKCHQILACLLASAKESLILLYLYTERLGSCCLACISAKKILTWWSNRYVWGYHDDHCLYLCVFTLVRKQGRRKDSL